MPWHPCVTIISIHTSLALPKLPESGKYSPPVLPGRRAEPIRKSIRGLNDTQLPALLNQVSLGKLRFLFFFLNFYCYSITCLFSPSFHPTPAEPTSLPHLHTPPWFCPCLLYSSSCNPLSSLSPPHSPLAMYNRTEVIIVSTSCGYCAEQTR